MTERVKRAPPQPGDKNYRPANGPGWGGPAKGRGNVATKESAAAIRARRAALTPDEKDQRKAQRARKRERMLAVLEGVAFSKTSTDANKVNAADKWLDRTEGRPVQPNANFDGGKKSLEELIAESMAPDGSA